MENTIECARKCFCSWIIQGDIGVNFHEYKWTGDGVFTGYPLVDTFDNFGHGGFLGFNYDDGKGRIRYYEKCTEGRLENVSPSYADCVNYGETPIDILDIACVSKGHIYRISNIS